MITRPTVLVLGAGASAPFGFPSGAQLKELITGGLRKDSTQLFQLLRQCGFETQHIKGFQNALALSGRPSVDLFLEHRPEFVRVGKTAIAASLMPYENEEKLFANGSDWYGYLYQQLGSSIPEITSSKLKVITFNYDRSFEWFLFTALKNSFALNMSAAVRHLASIPVVHVHGQLGELPHVSAEVTRPYAPSSMNAAGDALSAGECIKIVSEGRETDKDIETARTWIREAVVICFLGFGYLKENVQRLGFPLAEASPGIYGSVFGLRDGEVEGVGTLFRPNRSVSDPLFKDYDALEFLRRIRVLM